MSDNNEAYATEDPTNASADEQEDLAREAIKRFKALSQKESQKD